MEERFGGLATSTVQFADDIATSDVQVTVNGDDLIIGISATEDSMTVPGGAKSGTVPSLAFADGTIWSPADVSARATGA
jgi:hypothetical protein